MKLKSKIIFILFIVFSTFSANAQTFNDRNLIENFNQYDSKRLLKIFHNIPQKHHSFNSVSLHLNKLKSYPYYNDSGLLILTNFCNYPQLYKDRTITDVLLMIQAINGIFVIQEDPAKIFIW